MTASDPLKGCRRKQEVTNVSKTTSQIILVGGYLLLLFGLVIAGNALVAEAYHTFVTILLSILIEAIPFLLSGALVSGLIHVF